METTSSPAPSLAGVARRFVQRLFAIGENRFQLLMVEMQEERDRLLDAVFLTVAAAAACLLCAIVWSAALVILFWSAGPVLVLGLLGLGYAILAFVLSRRLLAVRRHSEAFAATLDQLRKDSACLEKS